MATADATLKNTNVNSGTAVLLGAEQINYSWKNMVNTNTVSSKFGISEATFSGFESPTIVVRGVIPIDDSITNHISQKLLIDFATCISGDTYLKVTAGETGGTILGGRPTSGYETDGDQTLDTTDGITVQIVSFNINFSARETREGQAWNYTLTMVETT